MNIKLTVLLILFCSGTKAQVLTDFLTGYDSIKTQKLNTGHDVVSPTINGKTGLFVLDNTAAVSAINNRLIEKYNLKNKIKSISSAGAGGAISIDLYAVDYIKIGATNVKLKSIGVSDLNDVFTGIYNSTSVLIDGIIGQDVFIKGNSIIDISNHTILFPTNSTSQAELIGHNLLEQEFEKIELIEFNFDQHQFVLHGLKVQINGITKPFILDSESGRTYLNQATSTAFGISLQKGELSNSVGAGGAINIKRLSIKDLKIANNKINSNQVYLTNLSEIVEYTQHHTGQEVYGVIGQDILAKIQPVIVSSESKMYFKSGY